VYERRGAAAIVIAKFVPGLATVAPPLAGALRLGVWRFLLFDCIGAALYYGVGLALGVAFNTQIHWLIDWVEGFGAWALLFVLGALALYVAYRWWDRRRFIQSLRAGRIEVNELNEMMSRGEEPLVLDVRSRTHRKLDGRRIPGARGVDLDDLEGTLEEIPRDREVVVYCACPNEVTAVKVAMTLRDRGFQRVRPLVGGVEAWAAAGLRIDST
jgi:rhodanese-related sulfurtransferase